MALVLIKHAYKNYTQTINIYSFINNINSIIHTLKKEQSLFLLAGRIVNLILGISLQEIMM
jgi:hypothetical protein